MRVLPINPVLLHKTGGEAGVCGGGGDLAGMVGLDAADGDEGRGVLGEGVGDEVLEFAGFVAAVGEGGVEVFAFGVDGGVQIGGGVGEGVDGGGAEGEGVAGDGGEGFWEGDFNGHFACLLFLLSAG